MGGDPVLDAARAAVLARFRWVAGDADLWPVLRDPAALPAVVRALAEPFRDVHVDAVVGIEARGFVLGPAVAVELGAGFVPVRTDGGMLPGPVVRRRADFDYRGRRRELATRSDLVQPGDRVLLVDDWVEVGAQALAACALVEQCGGELVGLSVVVDQASDEARAALPPVRGVVSAAELGPSA
ncbi:phosphoribosyltransferase family protein [Cellulomonas sp. 179-A 9B4 NHS]|uniref:phosphoribosyltransferase family protein n=1 Tax=Cellulomonas sp. 179-A 9B4 NHS TaxID=3142379 RepID=UPI0039A1A860